MRKRGGEGEKACASAASEGVIHLGVSPQTFTPLLPWSLSATRVVSHENAPSCFFIKACSCWCILLLLSHIFILQKIL